MFSGFSCGGGISSLLARVTALADIETSRARIQGLTSADGLSGAFKSAASIKPGQFAILNTVETVKFPSNVIGFISMKSKAATFKGLVNISGFHVDPGYSGHLKFAVFNAGNEPIHLAFDGLYFSLWFAELNEATRDPYPGKGHTGLIGTHGAN